MKMYPLMDADSGSGGGSGDVQDTTTNDPVIPAPSTTVPVQTSSAPAGDSAEVWMTRYKGMQTAYNKLKSEKDTLQENHNTSVGELELAKIKVTELDLRVKELENNLIGEKESAQSIVTESTKKDQEVNRLRLIISDFPDLANFEKTGVLPTDPDSEELKKKLTAFRDAVKSATATNTKQVLSGSSLPSGTSSNGGQFSGLSISEMQDRLNKLAGRRDKRDEYLNLRNIYDKALEAADK